MCAQHLQGEQVRLVALKSDSDVEMMARWPAMSGVWRLLDAVRDDQHGPDQRPAASGVIFRVHAWRRIARSGTPGCSAFAACTAMPGSM